MLSINQWLRIITWTQSKLINQILDAFLKKSDTIPFNAWMVKGFN